MRNIGSKDKRPRYSSNAQMQARAKRLADAIENFCDQALGQYNFKRLTDFNKLNDVMDHLRELNSLKHLE